MIPTEIRLFVLIPALLLLIIIIAVIRRTLRVDGFSFWFDKEDALEVHFHKAVKLKGRYMEELHIPYPHYYEWLIKNNLHRKRCDYFHSVTNKRVEFYVVLTRSEYKLQNEEIIKTHLKKYINLYKKSKV